MRCHEVLLAVVVYAVAAYLAAIAMRALDVGDAGIALVVGACSGSFAAAFAYHRRVRDERAPFSAKVVVGAAFAATAVPVALGFARLWPDWMPYPEIVIAIGALGSAIFPFVLFESARKSLTATRR